MKIKHVNNVNDREFHQLVVGQVFQLGKDVYMKLDLFNTQMNNFNAINLSTAKFTHVSASQDVEWLPNAELHTR